VEELLKEHGLLRQHVEYLKAKFIEADGLLIAGATIEMILAEVKKLAVDLVIIGYHHHSLMYNFFTGSTHAAIVKKANVPVLIVPLQKSSF
jgi:nucleotide-binding universal stress UspA family protein